MHRGRLSVLLLLGIVGLIGVSIWLTRSPATAQSPVSTPTPLSPIAVTVAAGGTATLSRFVGGPSAAIENRSSQPTTVYVYGMRFDGFVVGIAAPPRSTVSVDEATAVRVPCPAPHHADPSIMCVTPRGGQRIAFTLAPTAPLPTTRTPCSPGACAPRAVPRSEIEPGQSVTVARGATQVFAHPSRRASGAMLTIPVSNQSDQPATVVDDGTALVLTLPIGTAVAAEIVYTGLYARAVACATEPGAAHIARCPVVEERATQVSIRFSVTR